MALMHAQGLCHADIKPENILLTGSGQLKLTLTLTLTLPLTLTRSAEAGT